MKCQPEITDKEAAPRFIEGRDYYFDSGLLVMTARFLTERGYCCGNGCRHCPYDDVASKQKDI